jgi:hypothetical protein
MFLSEVLLAVTRMAMTQMIVTRGVMVGVTLVAVVGMIALVEAMVAAAFVKVTVRNHPVCTRAIVISNTGFQHC